MNRYYFLVFSIVFLSCSKKTISKNSQWSQIIIKTDNQKIWIASDTNVCFSQVWTYRDSLVEGERWRVPVKSPSFEFQLSVIEKDSLYIWIDHLINSPDSLAKRCSDYVGNVYFEIRYGEYSRACSYSSICKWQAFNSSTSKISNLLRTKTPLANE